MRAKQFRRGSEWVIDSRTFEDVGCGRRKMASTVGKIIIFLGSGGKMIISKSFSTKVELMYSNFNADFATILIAESSD